MDGAKRERMAERIMEQLATHENVLGEPLGIECPLLQWYSIHAALQVALRHPHFVGGDVREMVEQVVRTIEDGFEVYGLFDQETLEFLRSDQAEAEVEGQARIVLTDGEEAQTR